MKIKQLKAHNFWSFQDINLDFDKQGLTIIHGNNFDNNTSNGAGKTGLINAISYVLLGTLPKKIKNDEIINRLFKKDCWVKAVLEGNRNTYRIERGRKPNFLKFYINDKIIEDTDVVQLQKTIEKILKFTYDTFFYSVYFPQNTSGFLELNDSAKKDFLTDLIGLGVLDKIFDKIKKDQNEKEGLKNNIEYQVKVSTEQSLSLNRDVEDLNSKNVFFKQLQEDKKKNLDTEINSVNGELYNHQAIVLKSNNLKESAIKELETFLATKEKTNLALNTLESKIAEINKSKQEYQTHIVVLNQSLSKYSLSDTQCPMCFQKIDKTLLESLKNQDEIALANYNENIKIIDAELNKIPDSIWLKKKRNELFCQEQQIKSSIESFSKDIVNAESLIQLTTKRLSDLQNSLSNKEANPYEELIINAKNRLGLVTKKIESLQAELAVKNSSIEDLENLKIVFGPKGLKSYVFEGVLSELNLKLNEYLSKLFENDIKIFFENKSSEVKGDFRAVFETHIVVDGEDVGWGSFSGGEFKRVNLALNFALSHVINTRLGSDWNVLFLDEVTDGICSVGKRKIFDLFTEMATKKDSIFVIDHDVTMQALFDNNIQIEKRNGISTII